MSASDALPGQQLQPLSSTDGGGEYQGIPPHLNAAFSANASNPPDSTADHPLTLLGGGSDPSTAAGNGSSPDLTMPVG